MAGYRQAAETTGKKFVLLPFDTESREQGLTKSIDLPSEECELKTWAGGQFTREQHSGQRRFVFTLRVEMDGTLRDLKIAQEQKLLVWLQKAGV